MAPINNRRTPAPTNQQLTQAEESSKDAVVACLVNCAQVDEATDSSTIKNAIQTLKAKISAYEANSRALSNWFREHGSSTMAMEVRVARVKLVYNECAETVKDLNNQLRGMGEDATSSIGSVSVMATNQHAQSQQIENEPVSSSEASSNYNDARPSVPPVPERRSSLSSDSLSMEGNALPDKPEQTGKEKVQDFIDKLEEPTRNTKSSIKDQPGSVENLDPISKRQLKIDLLKGHGEPFNGDPKEFYTWKHCISRWLLEAEVGALDSLLIIRANTSGRPKKLVSDFIAAGSRNPVQTLDRVWKALTRRFGNSVAVSQGLLDKLENFPKVKTTNDISSLQDLHDLCLVMQANMDDTTDLKILNLSCGLRMVWEKTPDIFQSRWRKQCHQHEKKFCKPPNFEIFLDFLSDFIDEVSSPAFAPRSTMHTVTKGVSNQGKYVKSFQTTSSIKCLYHDMEGHSIINCKKFKKLDYSDKRKFASDNRLCYNCLQVYKAGSCCPKDISCSICQGKHLDVMHRDRPSRSTPPGNTSFGKQATIQQDGNSSVSQPDTITRCQEVCGNSNNTRICSKTLLVDIRLSSEPDKTLRCLAIIDEQSNSTFCDPKVPAYFKMTPPIQPYSLTTMSGFKTSMDGMMVDGLEVKGVTEKEWIKLPTTISHHSIPGSLSEVASPEIVASHHHIRNLAKHFPQIDPDSKIMLLIGADCGAAMSTRCFGQHYPYVHKTALGWALVGPVCTSPKGEGLRDVKTYRTQTLNCEHLTASPLFRGASEASHGSPYSDVFIQTPDDDRQGLSRDDQLFLDKAHSNIKLNEEGKLELPLPLKPDHQLSNNRNCVYMRSKNTLNRLKRDSTSLQKATDVMGKYITLKHVERVPQKELTSEHQTNYIPIFPVVHPRTKKLRIVFDSSASYRGRSLNDVLLQGPDEGNKIVGVLTRFRHGKIGLSADIECMFHSFCLSPEHRDLVRFFWWSDNDPSQEIVEYRSRVHNFGHKSSPAIANFCLRYTANSRKALQHPQACKFIEDNFYVDDLLASADSVQEAVSILNEVTSILRSFSIHLHKFVSSSSDVTDALPPDECANNATVQLGDATMHRTLGISWCTSSDHLVVKCQFPDKPLTKRGVLSTLHSLYDPLGLVAPVILAGKLIQRQMIPSKHAPVNTLANLEWDDPIPEEFTQEWTSWLSSLSETEEISIPRSFVPMDFGSVRRRELHIFCDASDLAIGYVIYLRIFDDQRVDVNFVFANSKVAPRAATSMPRLELCAALEGAHAAHYISKELQLPLDSVSFHSDSRVVLGYINNSQRRFSRYVTGRVAAILKVSEPSQWNYISSKDNVADLASRPQSPRSLKEGQWFTGPNFLWSQREHSPDVLQDYPTLPETVVESKILQVTGSPRISIVDIICQRTSDLMQALKILKTVCIAASRWLSKVRGNSKAFLISSKPLMFFIKEAQSTAMPEVIRCLSRGKLLNNDHHLSSLCPFLDESIVRVGGRLLHSHLEFGSKHPILLPHKHKVTQMILQYYHEKSYHQGRFITLGSLRQAGYHIHKGNSVIRQFLKNCVTCQKLRGNFLVQRMADLPPDRLHVAPPFSHTGLDTFGPFPIVDGRTTRRQNSSKKVWVLLLTCLNSRAVHLEPLHTMESSSFQLALERFMAVRGTCKHFRSDNGTNFLPIRQRMLQEDPDCTWQLTPPSASHQAGAWERKIGSIKRILAAAMKQLGLRVLSREEFNTLLQVAASIVNKTPLYDVSSDPNDPEPISPDMLLTMRDGDIHTPTQNLSHTDLLQYGKARYRRTQYLAEQFWVRWRRHFLSNLTERNKWKKPRRCIAVGDVVLMREPAHRNSWPMGVVQEVEPGRDGLVRTVSLRIFSHSKNSITVLRRCVNDLVLLIPSKCS